MIAPLVAVDAQLQRNVSNSLLQSSSPCSDIEISRKHSVAFSLSLSLFFAISHVGPIQTLAGSSYTSLDTNVRVVDSLQQIVLFCCMNVPLCRLAYIAYPIPEIIGFFFNLHTIIFQKGW